MFLADGREILFYQNGQVQVNALKGPMIFIRNPLWTQSKPYQDLPVLIFTLQQWDDMQRDKFHIGAAPVNPTMLSFNRNYVFALPARYNYDLPEGWKEVDSIVNNNPIIPSSPVSFKDLPADSQVLLCGGIPNGSTQKVTDTSRLFINMSKSIYADKDNNLQFSTASGDAKANWISNGASTAKPSRLMITAGLIIMSWTERGKLISRQKAALPDSLIMQ